MPSRKRAQGQARKAKQNPKYGSPSCKHQNPSLYGAYSRDDVKKCYNLLYDFQDKYRSAIMSSKATGEVMDESRFKYCEPDKANQELYRDLILHYATRDLLCALNDTSDISDVSVRWRTKHWVMLYVEIVLMHDERGGFESQAGAIEAIYYNFQ